MAEIIWDREKNELLKRERGVCFEDVEKILTYNQEIDLLENPARDGQVCYIVRLNQYIHVVPALINENEQIVLKTVYPSRKFNKKYGGK